MLIFGVFLLYNYVLVGKISIATYPVVDREFRIVDPEAQAFFENVRSIASGYLENGLQYIPKLLGTYFFVPTGFFVSIFAVFGAFKFKSHWKWIFISHFLLLIVLYNFHTGDGWPQYGTRYYYTGFFSVVILAIVGFKFFFRMFHRKEFVYYALIIVLCVNCCICYHLIDEYSYRFNIRLALEEDALEQCSGKNIVVFGERRRKMYHNSCIRETDLSFVELRDFKRNFFMSKNHLFIEESELEKVLGGALDENAVDRFLFNFPGYSICFHYDSVFDKLQRFCD
jgi:hypothetical protein